MHSLTRSVHSERRFVDRDSSNAVSTAFVLRLSTFTLFKLLSFRNIFQHLFSKSALHDARFQKSSFQLLIESRNIEIKTEGDLICLGTFVFF